MGGPKATPKARLFQIYPCGKGLTFATESVSAAPAAEGVVAGSTSSVKPIQAVTYRCTLSLPDGSQWISDLFHRKKDAENDAAQKALAQRAGSVVDDEEPDDVGYVTSDVCAPKFVDEVEHYGFGSPKVQTATRPPRHTSSKYDFVKVRVWLGDNSDHYYVLSRFLVSRMLTVTKIPSHKAIKIALELKKLLIDNSLLDVSQADLETNLFKLMERRGYGTEYINRYKMMTRFHHQRIPLIILVCGAACVGKSTIATQLAQRLNLPNVLQTDMVYELLRTAVDAPLATSPVWARDFASPEELITEFCRDCRIVRKGLDGDLSKAMKDGKPVIIEGLHLDPSLYLIDNDSGISASQKDPTSAPVEHNSPPSGPKAGIARPLRLSASPERRTSHALKALVESGESAYVPEDLPAAPIETQYLDIGDRNEGCSSYSPASASDIDRTKGLPGRKVGQKPSDDTKDLPTSKPPTKAIVVPIVLRMAEVDHQTLLEEWIACTSIDKNNHFDEEALINKFRIIQDYLCSFENQGLKVIDISATTFPQTLDWLHSYLLQCIERGCTSAFNQGHGT